MYFLPQKNNPGNVVTVATNTSGDVNVLSKISKLEAQNMAGNVPTADILLMLM